MVVNAQTPVSCKMFFIGGLNNIFTFVNQKSSTLIFSRFWTPDLLAKQFD